MVYAYQAGKYFRSILVEVLRENGEIASINEFFSKKSAEKLLSQWYPEGVQWLDGAYWNHLVYQNRNDLQRSLGFEI